jgi:hypothetical protein
MTNDLIPSHPLLRAAEKVRAQRAAERAQAVEEPTSLKPVKTTTQVRATLNYIPDEQSLGAMIGNALTALSRGIRWARGSIVNLLV